MRRKPIFHRSVETIVQQMNVVCTKDVLRDVANGRPLDINPGSQAKSYDFDDQTQIDWDKPQFEGFESLIDQHVNRSKIAEHLSPPAPKSDPAPVIDPAPTPDPAPVTDPA